MAENKPRTAEEIRADLDELQRLHSEHVGFAHNPAHLLAWHQARAAYEIAAQVSAAREILQRHDDEIRRFTHDYPVVPIRAESEEVPASPETESTKTGS